MTAAVEPVAGGAPETETSEVVASTPVLITVQEVAFSTATVLSPEPTTARRWYAAPSVVAMAVRRMMVSATPDNPAPRRVYPKRYSFLESASMSREMDRL
ncbi:MULTISPECIES: hypothetical protein [Mycobacterium]|uniref:Uncharacterized protein n=1 Tax=Mycobacterium kiyosense TaxID=2871094 RepID=A0A9P3Q5I3_9MYCO|nr:MULTISPECIES: hypothetical protein [Mycobacterium]BDE15213.1 hypothetical protein MKCMC460_40730 [Mycobacterium sp. 20KCMC460]GLB81695.1 hypothetical protein SRL2020028_09510 [Mycobacterium kiyosense]GLB87525.1 hypothetical protein SRL2020130_03420 [Mycobacterium kiyosense]GLB94275.1 hypothetical protein SRL2020226_10510 [Mycobacterium kiyosense]GLC03877.1 hypothetical protein SRL2020400_44680 [Mycobacterium kiyosense]